ncbi:uncharacterized protein [Macrobrachium rosenbergii]|uniref:uncharacterized protein n=1 Tax=Macrobrachium rosenbergii TaxID=79674 RepID=UPI0034D517B6
MAVVPKALNRWRGGLVLHLFLHAEWVFLTAHVFPSCSATNPCSTNPLNPRQSIFSSNFTEGMETKIETFAGRWDPFQIRFLKQNQVQYKILFIERTATFRLTVRKPDKYLTYSDLGIDFRHSEVMSFGLRKDPREDSRVWVLDVKKGEFLKTVQLTGVSLDDIDSLEVYNEKSSRRRNVLFCYPHAPPLTEALETTCPTCPACPETAPCPECEVCLPCQAHCKCEEDCLPVTADVITGTSSQITTRDYPAKVTCPPCPSTALPVSSTCPQTTACPECEDSHPGLTSPVYESSRSGDVYRSTLAEPLTTGTADESAKVHGDGTGCPEAKLLLYIMEIALALCTLATIVSTALACQYRRKLSLAKGGKHRTSSVLWDPSEGYRPRVGDTHPLEHQTDKRDSIHCHVYEDPYKYQS